MKPLAQIGYYGQKALIGIQCDLEANQYLVLRARLKGGLMTPLEVHLFIDKKELFDYLKNYPGIGILLSFPKLESLEAFVSDGLGESDITSQVMGVSIDRHEDFAWQSLEAKSGKLISLIRKDELQKALESFDEMKDRIIGLNISESPLSYFIQSLSEYDASKSYLLELRESRYCWKGGLVEDHAADLVESIYPEEIARELGVEEPYMGLFAAMSLFQLAGINSFTGFAEQEVIKDRLFKKQLLAKGLSIGIIAMLGVLLLSAMLFGSLQLSSYLMEEQIKENRAILTKIKTQSRKLQEKSSFFQKAGAKSLAPSKVSLYLDRISEKAGKEIRFDKISYKPPKEALKKVSPELLSKKVDILLEGYTREGAELASFSASLQELAFIESLEVFNSSFSFEENLQRFVLIISLNES
ncbi:MAG: hypothetical protein AAFR87_11505 [Bacteroidota bacterium]